MNQPIICFGEMLWDMLPSGKQPGGAPMNVAVHFTRNGLTPLLVSRVGNDEPGAALLEFVRQQGLSTQWVQSGPMHRTGIVHADVSDKNEVSYQIVKPVAWDYIQYAEEVADLVRQSSLFIYGSLAARCKTSHETLRKYLGLAPVKVLDVNLRSPHYTPQRVQELMECAHMIKLNHHELAEITDWFGGPKKKTEEANMEYLLAKLGLDLLIVTRGEKGAAVLTHEQYTEHPGFAVEVADTIGSGDAFLAAFLSQWMKHNNPEKALAFACATGAWVATQPGATPAFSEATIEDFLRESLHSKSLPSIITG